MDQNVNARIRTRKKSDPLVCQVALFKKSRSSYKGYVYYKNGEILENKILYDTLYRDSGIERPKFGKDFFWDRETVRKLLDGREKLINGYEEAKNVRSYEGVIVYMDKVARKEDKQEKDGK